MEVKEAQRFEDALVTRLYLEGGGYEDFKRVRGSVAFPFEGMPGIILIGGEKKDTGLIKVLVEREFQNTFDLPVILGDLEKRYGPFCVFYGKNPETEENAKHLKKRFKSVHIGPGLQGSESYNFEIQLVNHLFERNKLIVPKNGILATELETGWESFLASEQKLRGILALFWLVIGIEKGDFKMFKRPG